MSEQGFVITRASREDLSEILDLQYLAYLSEADLFRTRDIPPLKQTLDEINTEYGNGTVLKMTAPDGRIIGSVRAREENGTAYIGKLMVHPDFRRHGLGSGLIAAIEEIYPGRRYELFTSSRSVDNIRLYQKLGYEIFTRKQITGELIFVYLQKQG